MTLVEKRSKPWVDGLRGMAMLFVLFGHAGMPAVFNTVTSPIKIPLFFAITGYLFRDQGGKQLEFLGKLLLRLVIPWLVLATLRYIPGVFTKGPMHLWYGFLEVLNGGASWYMPCCIIAQIIHFYVRKFCRHNAAVTVTSLVIGILGYVLCRFGILSVAMFNRALLAQLFLLIGFLFQKWENKALFSGWVGMIISGLLYVGLCLLSLKIFPGKWLDVHRNSYYSLILCPLMILVGCMAVLIGGRCVGKAPAVLRFVGQNTLVFYICGYYPQVAFGKLLGLLGLSMPGGWLGTALNLTVTILGCSGIAIVLNWLIPELVGKKRNKKKK